MHEITNAYDAWWFLYEHPKFKLRERTEVKPEEADELEKKGYLITRDRGGKCYKEYRHLHRHALEMNLDIYYAKVDEDRIVNSIPEKNVNVEVWLEFGPEEYGYDSKWHEETYRQNYHDPGLDCGAPTFDEALVELAKLVMKNYGDYNESERIDECGQPVCGDCEGLRGFYEKGGSMTKIK